MVNISVAQLSSLGESARDLEKRIPIRELNTENEFAFYLRLNTGDVVRTVGRLASKILITDTEQRIGRLLFSRGDSRAPIEGFLEDRFWIPNQKLTVSITALADSHFEVVEAYTLGEPSNNFDPSL